MKLDSGEGTLTGFHFLKAAVSLTRNPADFM